MENKNSSIKSVHVMPASCSFFKSPTAKDQLLTGQADLGAETYGTRCEKRLEIGI